MKTEIRKAEKNGVKENEGCGEREVVKEWKEEKEKQKEGREMRRSLFIRLLYPSRKVQGKHSLIVQRTKQL